MRQLPDSAAVPGGLRPGWLLRVLLVLVFVLQLFMAMQHHHAPGTVHDDCVACDLAMQFSGSAPATEVLVLALVLVGILLARAPCYHFQLPSRRYLLPFSQAPPAYS